MVSLLCTTGDALLKDIKEKLPAFNAHHDLALWQDADWQHLKRGLPRGAFLTVQDFAENIHHEVRFEPQSKYWSQISSTLYMVVVRFHLDDANHIPDVEKETLREAFAQAGVPPIIVETHAFVSADKTHRSGEAVPLATMLGDLHNSQMLAVFVKDSPHEPWMLGKLLTAGSVQATEADVKAANELRFSSVKLGTPVLRLLKYEPFEEGSRRYVECKMIQLVVPTTALRRHKLVNNCGKELRRSQRVQSSERYGEATFELKEEDHRAIVAIMQTEGIGDFTVEKILKHRVVTVRKKPHHQFLVKWLGWDREADLTWEPLSHFQNPQHVEMAHQMMEAEAVVAEAAMAAAAMAAVEAEAATAAMATAVAATTAATRWITPQCVHAASTHPCAIMRSKLSCAVTVWAGY